MQAEWKKGFMSTVFTHWYPNDINYRLIVFSAHEIHMMVVVILILWLAGQRDLVSVVCGYVPLGGICLTISVTKYQCFTCQRHYGTIIRHVYVCVCLCVCLLCAQVINTFFPFSEKSHCGGKWKRRGRADPMDLHNTDAVASLGMQTFLLLLSSCWSAKFVNQCSKCKLFPASVDTNFA